MEIAMIFVFVLGYLAIALEHPLKVDKAASSLITGMVCWALYVFTQVDHLQVEQGLMHHLYDIANILFFLLGAMTIVELVDAHEGFCRDHRPNQNHQLGEVALGALFLDFLFLSGARQPDNFHRDGLAVAQARRQQANTLAICRNYRHSR